MNGNGNGKNGSALHLARNFAPVLFPTDAARNEVEKYGPAAFGGRNLKPEIRYLQVSLDPALIVVDPDGATYQLSISEPTLVKLLLISCNGGSTGIRQELDLGWRCQGDAVGGLAFQNNFIPFAGPFAYLVSPGLYEIGFLLNPSAALTSVIAELQIATGLDPVTTEMLLDPRRIHAWISDDFVLAAGVEQPLPNDGTYHRWPTYKSAIISNAGVNPLNFYIGNDTGVITTVAAGASFTIEADLLGRGTIRAVSALGTTVSIKIGTW